MRQFDGDRDTVKGIRKLVISLYAGAEAERRIGATDETVDTGAGQDNEQAEEWLPMTGSTESDLRDETSRFVTDNWPLIERIATELMQHKKLDWEEMSFLLDIYRGDATQDDLNEYRQIRRQRSGE